jgi:chloramphenicol 3-O phosphotransferase
VWRAWCRSPVEQRLKTVESTAVVVRIIYLNGTSSAGKSSIALALYDLLDDLYLHVQLDSFLQMVPPHGWECEGGTVMTPSNQDHGLEVEFGPVCQALFSGFHRSLAALASAGNNLIVDDVLLEPRWLQEALEALISHEVCFVGVRCPVDVAQSRERVRGNRIVGTARGQFEWVHAHGIYDVEVDTSILRPEACAARIVETQRQLAHPSAFERLHGQAASQSST